MTVEVVYDISVVSGLSVINKIDYTGSISYVTSSSVTSQDGYNHLAVTYRGVSAGTAAAYVTSSGGTYSAELPIHVTDE